MTPPGQAALYGLGTAGIPIVNVNNNAANNPDAVFRAPGHRRRGPRLAGEVRAADPAAVLPVD